VIVCAGAVIAALLTGAFWLVKTTLKSPRFYRRQTAALVSSKPTARVWLHLGEEAISQKFSKMIEVEHGHARQMELLNAITQAALSTADLPHLLQTLADRLCELFAADGAYLTLWDESRQRAIPAAAYGEMRTVYPTLKTEPGERTLTEAVLRTGHVLVVEDSYNSPYISPRIAALFPTRSSLALPLIVDDKKLGATIISYIQIHRFTEDEISLGEQAAGQIALAVAKAQLVDAERRRAGQLAALQSISQAIVSSLELNQIFDTVVHVLHHTFGYKLVSIYRLYGEWLHLGAQVGYQDESVYWKIPVSRGVVGRTVRTRKPQLVKDVSVDPDFLRASDEIDCEICVPLLKEQTVLGTLNIESCAPRSLTEEDLEFLVTFAGQTAVAIENARIFAEMQRRAIKEWLLLEAIRDFTAGLDTEAVINAIVEHMVRAIEVSGCTVSRWDEAGGRRVTLLDYDIDSDVSTDNPGNSYSLDEYPVTRSVLENLQPVLIRCDDPSIDPAEQALLKRYGNKELFMLPLVVGREKKVFGLIELFRKEYASSFSKSDLELAQSLAAQSSIALENALLYAETQRLAIMDELTSLYNRRGFFELGRREFERADRYGHALTALFLDIDHFKVFNDTYSYAVGDQVLRRVAISLKNCLREVDLVGRYGGEEIIVLLPETPLHAAVEVAERICRMVETIQVETDQGEASITVSVGVCQKLPEMDDIETLIDCAGQALHEAKQQGRNRVVYQNCAGQELIAFRAPDV